MDAVKFAFVPPRASESCPVQPAVMDVACKRAVFGVPPSVRVTFVSSVLVKAAGVGSCAVVANVPDAGKVTVELGLWNVKIPKPPDQARVFASELFTPVPPREGASCPVHPAVMDVACKSAVFGVPPSVKVTFVSLVRVNAAGVGSCVVVASVPDAGKVTVELGLWNVKIPKPPDQARVFASELFLLYLLEKEPVVLSTQL